MSQVNSVKDLRNKHAKCLAQNRGQAPLVDIKGSSYDRSRTTVLNNCFSLFRNYLKYVMLIYSSIEYF